MIFWEDTLLPWRHVLVDDSVGPSAPLTSRGDYFSEYITLHQNGLKTLMKRCCGHLMVALFTLFMEDVHLEDKHTCWGLSCFYFNPESLKGSSVIRFTALCGAQVKLHNIWWQNLTCTHTLSVLFSGHLQNNTTPVSSLTHNSGIKGNKCVFRREFLTSP